MSKYSELLRLPQWQKKRLETMERDCFACQFCGNKEKTLNVHHINYEKGKKPWEYSDNILITLCEKCHKTEHKCEDDNSETDFQNSFKEFGIPSYFVRWLLSSLFNLGKVENVPYHKKLHLMLKFLSAYSKEKISYEDLLVFLKEKGVVKK